MGTISTKIPDTLEAAARDLAGRTGTTVAGVLRAALEAYMCAEAESVRAQQSRYKPFPPMELGEPRTEFGRRTLLECREKLARR